MPVTWAAACLARLDAAERCVLGCLSYTDAVHGGINIVLHVVLSGHAEKSASAARLRPAPMGRRSKTACLGFHHGGAAWKSHHVGAGHDKRVGEVTGGHWLPVAACLGWERQTGVRRTASGVDGVDGAGLMWRGQEIRQTVER